MATAKQLAALKKARAARKKKATKRVGTSQTKKSVVTKTTPSKRLKARRAKNTRTGYYPNPNTYVVAVVTTEGKSGYLSDWTTRGPKFDDTKYHKFSSRKDAVIAMNAIYTSKVTGIKSLDVKKK